MEYEPAIASAMAGPQKACTLSSSSCVKLCCHARFQSGTVLSYSSILILSSVYSTGAVIGSLPFVRRALSLPPAWVLGGGASNSDMSMLSRDLRRTTKILKSSSCSTFKDNVQLFIQSPISSFASHISHPRLSRYATYLWIRTRLPQAGVKRPNDRTVGTLVPGVW